MKWSSVWNSGYSLAAFTAICGFILAVILQRIQDRRAPRKAISWDAEIERPARLEKDNDNRIGISYNGTPVKDLVQVRILMENTGNTLIRNEYVRFRMPSEARILEITSDPAPEQELGVSEDESLATSHAERRYKIGHLEAKQSVSFLIVTDGGAWHSWQDIHPYNEEGDVLFQQRDIARAKEDAEEVQPFIRNLVALILLAILISITPTPASYAFSVLFLIPAINIVIAAPRILRVMRQLTGKNLYTVHVADSKGIQIGDENTQVNRYEPERPTTLSAAQATSVEPWAGVPGRATRLQTGSVKYGSRGFVCGTGPLEEK
jgi:RIP homotypic interaction motif